MFQTGQSSWAYDDDDELEDGESGASQDNKENEEKNAKSNNKTTVDITDLDAGKKFITCSM